MVATLLSDELPSEPKCIGVVSSLFVLHDVGTILEASLVITKRPHLGVAQVSLGSWNLFNGSILEFLIAL